MPQLTVLLLCGLVIAGGPTGLAAAADVPIVHGELEHFGLSNELFHVDHLWLHVAENTEFHRWLSQGIGRSVSIVLTTNAGSIDEKDTRILTGTLIHNSAPTPTSNTVDVVGRLPPGDMETVHELFLRDEVTGTIGAVTFETSDSATVLKFQGYDDARVSIVIRME